MPQAAAIAILFAALSSVYAALPGPPPVFSANGKYSLELSSPAAGELLLGVYAHVGDSKSLAWSRKTDWRGIYEYQPKTTPIGQIVARITSDGETVILRDSEAGMARGSNDLRILCRDEQRDAVFRPFDTVELSGGDPGRPKSTGMTWHAHRSIFDLLTPKEDRYALWFAQSDKWFTVSLKDLSGAIVRDERQIARLNELGHARAQELIHQHQPPPLKKAAAAIRKRLASIVPAIAPPRAPDQHTLVDASPGYFFVAARKRSLDRRCIDRLLEFPPGRPIFAHSLECLTALLKCELRCIHANFCWVIIWPESGMAARTSFGPCRWRC